VARPSAIAALVVVSALVGGAAALGIGKATGWIGEAQTQTVVLSADGGAAEPAVDQSEAAKPLAGNGFDPAELYRSRAAGVVTIYALFGDHAETGGGAAAQGSGFVVSDEGVVLTNAHVVTTAGEGSAGDPPEPASTVYVQFRDGDRVEARIAGFDVYSDVAALELDPAAHELDPVPLGNSNRVQVGEPVAAIGSPFGNESSLAVGVVSAVARSIASLTSCYDLGDAIQTDAPINRGNSGGPLFNARGQVIGINAQIRSNSGNAEGVGFAVPINAAKRSMEQLLATGEARYAWMGISTQTLTASLARALDYPVDHGAVVQSVVADSPAARSGLRGGSSQEEYEGISIRTGGDVIVAIDGRAVQSSEDVVRAVSQRLLPGQDAVLTVLRGSDERRVTIRLGERPAIPPGSDC
jgi:S1-C subfamily serine protease